LDKEKERWEMDWERRAERVGEKEDEAYTFHRS